MTTLFRADSTSVEKSYSGFIITIVFFISIVIVTIIITLAYLQRFAESLLLIHLVFIACLFEQFEHN